MGLLKGILFDMDGVLVDSEAFICEAAIQMFAEHGVTATPADFLPFVGTGENRYLGGVAEKYSVPFDLERDKRRTYALYEQRVHGRLAPLRGVPEFLRMCRERGLKTAVATSADRIKMEINLREIGLPAEHFDATVNGLDIEHKKPHPEVFLTAAARLGLRPEECLVVEDAINGIQAARAAGCRCLALTTSFSRNSLANAGADWIAADLADAPEDATRW